MLTTENVGVINLTVNGDCECSLIQSIQKLLREKKRLVGCAISESGKWDSGPTIGHNVSGVVSNLVRIRKIDFSKTLYGVEAAYLSYFSRGRFSSIFDSDVYREGLAKFWDRRNSLDIFYSNPSALIYLHYFSGNFGLRRTSIFTVKNQLIGAISQSPSFESGPGSSTKSKNNDDQVYPIKAIVSFAIGLAVGIGGILSATLIAPRRGDWWGYYGIGLMLIGLWLCWFAGGFVRHGSNASNSRSENIRDRPGEC